jgi:hypothetical protein
MTETAKQPGKRVVAEDRHSEWKGEASSLRMTRVFEPPLPAVKAERWLAALIERIAANIATHAPEEVLGHVKCMGEADGKTIFVNIESFAASAIVLGGFPGPVGKMRITVVALIAERYAVQLRSVMEDALSGGEDP